LLHYATTALNDMEEAIQEVDSVSSQNAVDDETQSEDGNISMAEYASSLLKAQSDEEEPSEQPEEESESAEEEPAEEEETEEQSAEEPDEEDQAESPAEPSDVLSKFNIDLDTLSEDESRDLAKALNASAVKRFGRLTAQKKALLAENQELQAQAQAKEQTASTEQPEFLKDNALSNVTDVNGLTKEVENLTTLIEWTEEGLENEAEYDDDGNEYYAKDGDKTYTKADLRRIRANARKILRKDAPARQKWIAERTESDQHAIKTFSFLSDGESEEYQLFMQTKENPLYKPLVEHLPNGNFALGLMIEGMKAVQARQADSSKPKPKPKAPVASAEAGAAKPRTESSSRKKALQAARTKFEKSGNIADYQNYIKLRDSA
jgi:hypothetical protein